MACGTSKKKIPVCHSMIHLHKSLTHSLVLSSKKRSQMDKELLGHLPAPCAEEFTLGLPAPVGLQTWIL
jgi:hypothetical protein